MSDNRDDLAQLEDAVTNHAVIVDELNIAMRPAGDFGIKSRVGLTLVLYSGLWPVAGEPTEIAQFTTTLTDNQKSGVRMSDAGIIDVVSLDDSPSAHPGWPARYAIFTALYDFTFAAGLLTGSNDWRVGASVAALNLSQVLSVLGIDNWAVTGVGPYQITITKGAYSTVLDLT